MKLIETSRLHAEYARNCNQPQEHKSLQELKDRALSIILQDQLSSKTAISDFGVFHYIICLFLHTLKNFSFSFSVIFCVPCSYHFSVFFLMNFTKLPIDKFVIVTFDNFLIIIIIIVFYLLLCVVRVAPNSQPNTSRGNDFLCQKIQIDRTYLVSRGWIESAILNFLNYISLFFSFSFFF